MTSQPFQPSNSSKRKAHTSMEKIRRFHRINALMLLLFLLPHLVAHLFALSGPQAHEAALDLVRWTYRHAAIETLLVVLFSSQILLGIGLARAPIRLGTSDRWSQWQLLSGGYLAFFVLLHGTAALVSRYGNDLPTNFDWVAAPLQHPITKWVFYPYYALAVLALLTHIAAALHFRGHRAAARVLPAVAMVIAICYLASFGGWLFPVEAQQAYLSVYEQALGR